jgi:uncharacterized membrane protein YheB (UPF0754 family)
MEAFFIWLFHSVLRPVFWFQPAFYAVHGWLATEMALWMLFHPYEAKYVPGTRLRLPFTPGILPRGRENLFQSIADTVTTTLLTEEDIRKQAEKLITEENLVAVIEAVLNSVERELHSTEQIRRIYRYGETVVPDLLQQTFNSVLGSMESGKTSKTRTLMMDVLGQLLPTLQLNYHQAEFLTDALFNTLLTPAYIRHMLVEGLSEGNILLIEKGISTQIGGVKGILVRFMGVEKTLTQLRDFCKAQPEDAEARITEFLDKLEVRERLAERVSQFSFAELQPETRDALLGYTVALLTETISDNRAEIQDTLAKWSGIASRMVINRVMQINLKSWLNEKRPDLKKELARFLNRYLHRELALMIRGILPALGIGAMIVDKLGQFTNAQLEHMIYGICKRELRWLAFLGAFLGFWLGLVSNVINYWLQSWNR